MCNARGKPGGSLSSRPCVRCKRGNPPFARFCGSCGTELPVRAQRSCCGSGAGPVIAVGVFFALFALGILPNPRREYRNARVAAVDRVEHTFHIASAKARAMFDLLAPDDVRVLVGRRDDAVYVRGTSSDVRTVERFVDLLTRSASRQTAGRRDWFERKYELTKEKAKLLSSALAPSDVPVLVSLCEYDAVCVQASPHDHTTIANMVAILRGR